jgi:lysophospholipase L1-like esterase
MSPTSVILLSRTTCKHKEDPTKSEAWQRFSLVVRRTLSVCHADAPKPEVHCDPASPLTNPDLPCSGIARVAGLLCVIIVAVVTLMSSPPASAVTPPKFKPPKSYYLALGDSITYGFQLSRARAGLPPSAFNTGYVDDFGARLQQIQPSIITVNYGCPGETTKSFIDGPCPWTAGGGQLHDSFSGSQLGAAVAFLRAHPGDVSPITLTLWGNDVREFVGSCTDESGAIDPVCIQKGIPGFFHGVSTNLDTILGKLRAAAPNAEIIVTGTWDSFIGAFEFADPLFQLLNTSMANVAAANLVWFADPFPVFNPQGDLDAETQAICTLLLLCTENDSHPSDAGYQALADVVFEASRYARLLE